MESSKEPVSVRVARINSEITGKTATKTGKSSLLTRECLLDILQVLYDECSTESLQKYDACITEFVKKHKNALKEIKLLRVNLSDFEIKNIIGRGHFGEVHVVKEKQTGDVYAMKTIRKFDNDIKRISFEEERNIMAFSNSPWLTSLQYAFQDTTNLFFIMEYHPGGDLLGLLYRQGGTLPESASTFYIAELVLALEDLHSMGYVHRDIKPDNILLDRCGHLKLADFGSAVKLNKDGNVSGGMMPVGTPDYIAPEVLQSLDNKSDKNSGYGISCDFWSLGVLAYELAVGNKPFQGQNSTAIYAKIMNHNSNLKFPPDIVLSQAYVTFVKSLITDHKKRLDPKQTRSHVLFKNTNFDTLRDQVPPYVPKITSIEDTSNFNDIPSKKKNPSIENFKKRTQFSGRNLPFVGFTFTHDPSSFETGFEMAKSKVKDELIDNLKLEIEKLRKEVIKGESFVQEKDCIEKKFEEKSRKLESIEVLRDKLERDLASNIAECMALKRTLELERKDRAELERKALELIKSAKLKWETAEKTKVDALVLEIDQQKERITQLTHTNNILNDQLQHALKVQGKHKQSLEKVEDLSRRSVVGLESRLEKVTTETESTISNLKTQLSEEIHEKNVLANKLTKCKDKEFSLKDQLKRSEDNYSNLLRKVEEAESVIKQLSDKVNELEREMENIEFYKEDITSLQQIIENSHKKVKDLENKNTLLQMENKVVEDYKKEVAEMKEKISKMQNDKKVAELESKLFEERDKCLSLKKRLQESENVVTESQELKELRTKYWRLEKEFGNCKIDKRILERELKEAQAEIKELNEKIENLNKTLTENKRSHEAALLELSGINETLSMELIKAQESYKNLQDKLKSEKEKSDDEKCVRKELKDIVTSKEDKIKALNTEINNLRSEKIKVESQLKNSNEENTKLMVLVENLQKEKSKIQNKLDKSEREIQNTNLTLEALREACTLLESQVIEYEKINSSFQQKQSELNSNTEKLISDLCKAKQDIQEAKKLANEEKSLKFLAESKIKRLTEDIDSLQSECNSYKQQCAEYKNYSSELSEDLTKAEEKISDLEIVMKSYERQNEDLIVGNNMLKEEISEYLTQINKLKESSYKLNHQLSEAKETKASLMYRIRDLERILNEKSNFYSERELKADSTIKQQIKLIDYLQSKIDEQANKKKTLTEVLFGSSKKENQPPLSLAMNYKDLETQLFKERHNNKQLQEEIYKLKAATMIDKNNSVLDKMGKVERSKSEIMSPKSKIVMKQIVNSPNSQKNDLYRQNSLQRMHHNIPHRFESRKCTKTTKCVQCSNQIPVGKNMNVCKECNVSAHTTCSASLPHTCGLPQAFAKHYKETFERLSQECRREEQKEDDENVSVEGWIKVPSKTNGWDKCYAILTSKSLTTYNMPPKEPNSCVLKEFPLKPENSHGKVVLEPLASEIGVVVANSDLPFIIKVEVAPDTTCWPLKAFIFMTLSAKEKDAWFSALRKIYHEDEKSRFETILKLPNDLNINCMVDLTENIKILGTEKGLYSCYEKTLLHIPGFTEVHHISILTSCNMVLMIVNTKSTLISCDLNHLINLTQCAPCSKPTLIYKNVNVNNLNGFHILQVSKYENQQKACVATSKQIVILDYDLDSNGFIPVRILDTAKPTSCLLFTANSIIVGADKFFEIDLNSFQAEEFLDVSDAQLRQAVKCYKMGSFPLAIMQISKNPKEYLLCFNEFSIFVDEYGRSSRAKEIKSTHLPLAFNFIKQFLYVVQFSAVEIFKITEETCNDNSDSIDSVRLELEKFKYVGCTSKGIYICQDSEIKFLDAKRLVDLDASSIMSESTENGSEIDRFSFTSSMVQSLDGNLSDVESVEEPVRSRKVKFSQVTNL